jgi:hypothetical protein
MQELNIVELIEKNPIAKLTHTYNNKLLCKIKESFVGFEQQLFVSSFYCYLNYDKSLDYVVDLDDVWKWIGFTQKVNAIRVLEKHFILDKDYKNFALQFGKASLDENVAHQFGGASLDENIASSIEENAKSCNKQHGGQNKQKIMLNIKCFKSLCLKVQTKKACEIHDYYIKLEEVMHEIVDEESNELRAQLEQKDSIIQSIEQEIISTKKEKQRAVEQATIAQFPLNTECIYFGTIENTNDAKESLLKFGHTNDLATRVQDHRKHYDTFILVEAFRVQNKVEIENLIKTHPRIKGHIRSIEVNGKNKTEIIAYDNTNFTLLRLSKCIRDIIHSKTYSIDNFNKLMRRNEELEEECKILKEQNANNNAQLVKQALEINELKETIEALKSTVETVKETHQSVYQNVLLPEDETIKKFNDFVMAQCIVRADVEDLSVNIEGRFRLWSHIKPTKETFHLLKNYLDTRFKPKRIQGSHGYVGIILKTAEYKKTELNSRVETFLFQRCKFSDTGKILNSTLLKEYCNWMVSIDVIKREELTDDIGKHLMKEIKEYLNASPYALKATVWLENESNEGYYGISLNSSNQLQNADSKNKFSTTGKKVEKREVAEPHNILGKWDTIAMAAQMENVSAAKMSRSIKNKCVFDDYYYCLST